VTHADSGTSHPDKKRLRKYLVPFNNERHAAENAAKKELRDRFALLVPKSESASGNASGVPSPKAVGDTHLHGQMKGLWPSSSTGTQSVHARTSDISFKYL
jgi:hypothetical protein